MPLLKWLVLLLALLCTQALADSKPTVDLYNFMPNMDDWVTGVSKQIGKLDLPEKMLAIGQGLTAVFMFMGIARGMLARNSTQMYMGLARGATALLFLTTCYSFSGGELANGKSVSELSMEMWNGAFIKGKNLVPDTLPDEIREVQVKMIETAGSIFLVKSMATLGTKTIGAGAKGQVSKEGKKAAAKGTQGFAEKQAKNLFDALRLNLLLFLPLNLAFTVLIYGSAIIVLLGCLFLPIMIAFTARGDSRWLLGYFGTFLAAIMVAYSAPLFYQWSLQLAYLKPLQALAQKDEAKFDQLKQDFNIMLGFADDATDMDSQFTGDSKIDIPFVSDYFDKKLAQATKFIESAVSWVWTVILNILLGIIIVLVGGIMSVNIINFTVRAIYGLAQSSIGAGPASPTSFGKLT